MKATSRSAKSRKNPDQGATIAAPTPPPAPVEPSADATADTTVDKLTPEEQMERFAQELKNEDWGHQPC
ncbi:MAG: hypothetical protein PSV13_20055 [Lacunisphaera sp.]|nr:hypothetical protein [Lacunisphaera sp.]